MKFFISALLILFTTPSHAMDAVTALKQHLPHFDYQGRDDMGEYCELDFYGQRDGSLIADMWATTHEKFHITKEMSFTVTDEEYKASEAPRVEGNGTVVRSFIVRPGPQVLIQRAFTVGERTWVSAMSCAF